MEYLLLILMSKKNMIIKAEQANKNAEIRNRDKWINTTLTAISSKIDGSSRAGLHSCTITIPLYVGAQNLIEASETLAILANELCEAGYGHYVDESGILVIEW